MNIFSAIYKNKGIDVNASRQTLEEQLEIYLNNLSAHTGKRISPTQKDRIWSFITRNNQVAEMLITPQHENITRRKQELIGKVLLGYVFCVDGRIPTVFLGGRFAKHWEVPAGEIEVIKRKSDGKLVPDSSDLNEALRAAAAGDDDLLEVVFAHTSLLDTKEGCYSMNIKKRRGELDSQKSVELANLDIIEEKTIPAITTIYNEFRKQFGLSPLKTVGVSCLFDTDTFGIILNYPKLKEGKSLSTTELTNTYKDELDDYFINKNIVFGSFKEKFLELKYLTPFTNNLLMVIESLLSSEVAPELVYIIYAYIEENFSHLTDNQKQALRFVLVRNIALQYLTGYAATTKKDLEHPFAHHEEQFMAVAMRGTTIGKFDPQNQAFSATPSDPAAAIDFIKRMLAVMKTTQTNKPKVLFISNSVNQRDLKENNVVLQRISGSNAGLFKEIITDNDLGNLIEKGELVPIPVLIDEESREVMRILDHSPYI